MPDEADDGNRDRRTDELIERVQKSGVTWFGGSNRKRRRALGWRTTPKDIDMTIDAVRKALES